MEFKDSQTLKNLASSFAGESQAGLRYQIVADMCMSEGFKCLADEIKAIAKNEVNHAKTFFRLITDGIGNVENINIDAGYPFEGKTLEESLKFSMEHEHDEGVNIYPTFATIARKEGFEEIAVTFIQTAEVEKQHVLKFKYFYESIKNGTLYKAKEPTFWECSECGYIETRESAWNVCPLCRISQGYVKLKLP